MKHFWMVMMILIGLLGINRCANAFSCTVTPANVAFGSISPITNTATTTTSSVSISCTWTTLEAAVGTRYTTVCMNLGPGSASTSYVPRYMADSNLDTLAFQIYSDSGYSTIWGSSSSSTATNPLFANFTASGTSTSASTTATVYGKIPASQTTVPTVSNATTSYSTTFSSSGSAYTAGYALSLLSPVTTCSGLLGLGLLGSTTGNMASFTSTANVVNNCNISTSNMNFGSTGLLSSTLTSSSTISVQCTANDAWKVALNGGTTSGNINGRQMKGASTAATINYQLYIDSGRSIVWGDGTTGSVVTGTGTGVTQAITVYGKVPTQITPAPDSYSDSVTATVYF